MFETAELGRSVGKEELEAKMPKLRLGLLEAQRELHKAGVPVIVLLAGADGAGKGETVKRPPPARTRRPAANPCEAALPQTARETARHGLVHETPPEAVAALEALLPRTLDPLVERVEKAVERCLPGIPGSFIAASPA